LKEKKIRFKLRKCTNTTLPDDKSDEVDRSDWSLQTQRIKYPMTGGSKRPTTAHGLFIYPEMFELVVHLTHVKLLLLTSSSKKLS
jgi:hypothetical protein